MSVGSPAGGAPGLTLQDEHDLVVGQVGDQETFVEPAGRGRAVLPPAVGAGAHHVGGVDDERSHLRYLLKSFGRSSAAAAFS